MLYRTTDGAFFWAMHTDIQVDKIHHDWENTEMVLTLNDTKRTAIAVKLADILAVQNLIIENEKEFLKVCNDAELRDRFQHMIADDEKNIGIVETVIVQYGIQEKPSENIQELVNKTQELMKGSELSFYEK